MPLFDLGSSCRATQSLGAPPEQAYGMSREILEAYGKQGFRVSFEQEKEFTDLVAAVGDDDGTAIRATVKLAPSGSQTRLEIALTGKIHVGGLKGAFASEAKVQEVAKEKLVEAIKKSLKERGLVAALHTISQRRDIYAFHASREASRLA